MPSYRKTKTPGVYVRHEHGCPRAKAEDAARCRCTPSFRGRRRHPVTRLPEWSPSMKDRAAVITWLTAAPKGQEVLQEAAAAGPTFRELGKAWLEGVENGSIGKRRGKKGSAYSETTLAGYKRSLNNQLEEEFGARPAAEIVEVEWQMWADRLAREGISRSRIRNHLAVASAIYGWASRPTRRLVDRNPTLAVELPPNDERPRMRVCTAEEAAQLLAALEPDDQVPYAIAFYAGLRRAEIYRLQWTDVDLDGFRLHVRKSKSEAGTDRRPPIAQTLRPILRAAWLRQGQPVDGAVSAASVMSGKLAIRATKAWKHAPTALARIPLHECRHTYASFLMAAGYTLKEIMEYMGHSNLAMVQRYVKLLPPPEETDPAERLNAYLARRAAS
jgi:integrase